MPLNYNGLRAFFIMRTYSIFKIPDHLGETERRARRQMLAQLGLAWLAMMQVMMFAFPGYLRSESMSAENLATLDQAIYMMNWAGFALTVPVVFYSALPIWRGAWRSLKERRVGMDIPVALGILVAFIPSIHTTWTGRGEVYFDSVTMFVAFLLSARYLELCAQQSVDEQSRHGLIETFRKSISQDANRLAFWFVVVQISLAILLGIVWFIYRPEHALAVVVALFVMSCPCALSMAVPTAVAAAQSGLTACPAKKTAEVELVIRGTRRISMQNLHGSIAWHFLMTPLAAVGLVQPWLAAIAMFVSSMAVGVNSLRVYRQRLRFGYEPTQHTMV